MKIAYILKYSFIKFKLFQKKVLKNLHSNKKNSTFAAAKKKYSN